MQLVPGWEKKANEPRIDLSDLIRPLFLCHCFDFVKGVADIFEHGTDAEKFEIWRIFSLLFAETEKMVEFMADPEGCLSAKDARTLAGYLNDYADKLEKRERGRQ